MFTFQIFKSLFTNHFTMVELSSETTWDPAAQIAPHVLEYLHEGKYTALNFFYQLVSLLKDQDRTGWVNMGIPRPEHIGDHMYRMAVICMTLDVADVDMNKCVQIALVHDISESLVGDIVPHDKDVDKVEKSKREYKAILYLSEIVSRYNSAIGDKILQYWLDYELQRNKEASIVKDVDKYELLLQTFDYERMHNRRMEEFWGCRTVIKNGEIKTLVEELVEQREAYLKAAGL